MQHVSLSLFFLFFISAFMHDADSDPGSRQTSVYYNLDKHFCNKLTEQYDMNIVPFIDPEFDSLSIPLKRAGNLILIETIIDGQSGNLIFDSGSCSELVLNKTYFRDYKRKSGKTVAGVDGTLQDIDVIQIDSMLFTDMVLKDKYADAVDLSRIENKIKSKVLGFFGLDMIDDFEFAIDLSNNSMKLFSLDRKGNRINSNIITEFDHTQDIDLINNVIFIRAEIAGKKLRFCFDTAAETNIVSHIESKKVIETINITGRAGLSGVGNRRKEVLTGMMNDFSLSGKKLNNMKTVIADVSALNTIYNTSISGVLGFDFLKQGIVTVNLKKKQFNMNFY